LKINHLATLAPTQGSNLWLLQLHADCRAPEVLFNLDVSKLFSPNKRVRAKAVVKNVNTGWLNTSADGYADVDANFLGGGALLTAPLVPRGELGPQG
jgi:hypothetical protein